MISEEHRRWLRPWIPVLILQGMGYLLPILLSAFLQGIHIWNPNAESAVSAASSAASFSGYAAALTILTDLICCVIFAWMYRHDSQGMHQKQSGNGWAAISPLLLGAAAFAGGIVCSRLLGWVIDALGFFRFFSNEAQEMLFAAPAWLQLVGLGLIVPLAEELCYRGLCYTRCCVVMRPVWAALLVSGLFAAGHGNVIQMVYAFPMALVITWFYERSGRRLSCAVLFHMGANLASVIGNLYGF